MSAQPAPELSRRVPIDRIGRQGFDIDIDAKPAELPALARRLNVPDLAFLRCRFHLGAVHGGVIDATGELTARATRICVASLEPFAADTVEQFSIRFVPEETLSPDDDIDAVDEIGYRGNVIDLGEVAVEQLGLALDPYPRRPDVVLEGIGSVDSAPIDPDTAESAGEHLADEEAEQVARGNPFAVLAARRTKPQ